MRLNCKGTLKVSDYTSRYQAFDPHWHLVVFLSKTHFVPHSAVVHTQEMVSPFWYIWLQIGEQQDHHLCLQGRIQIFWKGVQIHQEGFHFQHSTWYSSIPHEIEMICSQWEVQENNLNPL